MRLSFDRASSPQSKAMAQPKAGFSGHFKFNHLPKLLIRVDPQLGFAVGFGFGFGLAIFANC